MPNLYTYKGINFKTESDAAIFGHTHACTFEKGTINNTTNNYYIRTIEYIPIKAGNTATLNINNLQNDNNYDILYTYGIYDEDKNIKTHPDTTYNTYDNAKTQNIIKSNINGYIRFCFALAEKDEDNQKIINYSVQPQINTVIGEIYIDDGIINNINSESQNNNDCMAPDMINLGYTFNSSGNSYTNKSRMLSDMFYIHKDDCINFNTKTYDYGKFNANILLYDKDTEEYIGSLNSNWASYIEFTADQDYYVKIAIAEYGYQEISQENVQQILDDTLVLKISPFKYISRGLKDLKQLIYQNRNEYADNYDIATIIENYNKLILNTTGKADLFMYFTDPHTLSTGTNWKTRFDNYISAMIKVKENTPIQFTMCGGDWLEWSDDQEYAYYKLFYMDSICKNKLFPYYPIMGNHDNLEQMKLIDGEGIGTVTPNQMKNIMFQQTGDYYAFKTPNAMYIVLNTWSDAIDLLRSYSAGDSTRGNDNVFIQQYLWEELEWLCNTLISNTMNNIAIAQHILSNSKKEVVPHVLTGFVQTEENIFNAFNQRGSIVINNKTFNFSNCIGYVRYILGGHSHHDWYTLQNEETPIPILVTTLNRGGSAPIYDLIVADYDNGIIKSNRIGGVVSYLDEEDKNGINFLMYRQTV